MAAARQAEREILAGQWRGELHGVPVAVKDLYDMAGLPTTCSSRGAGTIISRSPIPLASSASSRPGQPSWA
jgi:Asp-tRNA(Asn)/Glu-tRNA(Gln) amidotransferase A subunit family amidase